MTIFTTLQILAYLAAAASSSAAAWKAIDELLRKGNASLRDDYRFAREFLTNIETGIVHPAVAELGYQAIARDSRVRADEIAYLLTLQNPQQAIRRYISARSLLEFFNTAPATKIVFRSKYDSPRHRKLLKFWYLGTYFATYSLGFAPLLLVAMHFVSPSPGAALFALTAIMFLPLAYLSVRAGSSITIAEALIKTQADTKAPNLACPVQIAGRRAAEDGR